MTNQARTIGGSLRKVRRCEMIGNGLDAVTRPAAYSALEFSDCQVRGNQRDQLPDAKPFSSAAPVAESQVLDCRRAEKSLA